MPNDKTKYGFTHQDLEPIIIHGKKLINKEAVKKAQRDGKTKVETKNKMSEEGLKMKKLDEDTENYKLETVNKSISQEIVKARAALKMKQKDLANKINVPVQTIQNYENGKAQPEIKILQKLERVLKCKLTGKGFTK